MRKLKERRRREEGREGMLRYREGEGEDEREEEGLALGLRLRFRRWQ